MVVIFNLH